jgi:hypothetical protein
VNHVVINQLRVFSRIINIRIVKQLMLELPEDYLNSSLAHFKNKISLEGRSRISKVAQVSYFVEKLRL